MYLMYNTGTFNLNDDLKSYLFIIHTILKMNFKQRSFIDSIKI